MKKLISLIVTAALAVTSVLALAGCNAAKETQGETGAASDFKVGAIYINSQNDTAGYTYAHHHGITEAMKQVGLDPAKDLYFDEKAKEYPDIIFSHATGYLSNDTNFNNYFGRIYQARYLAGIAAGYKSLATGNNNIGYVSAWGTEYAETCSGINGFALGVLAVNPDAKISVYEISTWGDQELERQAAETLIDTYGCGVIAQHCDSAQPQIVANEKGVFGCGYNSDMTKEAPNAHLAAPVWNWDAYYATAIKAAMENPATFMTTVGNYYEGLNSGLVDVSELSANCEPETKEAIELAKKMMISGEWDVFSGVKLSFSGAAGSVSVEKTNAALVANDGTEIVAAGGPSVDDGVIQGSMNYYVEGVTQVN